MFKNVWVVCGNWFLASNFVEQLKNLYIACSNVVWGLLEFNYLLD